MKKEFKMTKVTENREEPFMEKKGTKLFILRITPIRYGILMEIGIGEINRRSE